MADVASSTIHIAAPPERVLAVIADIDRYPEWTGQIKSTEVLETDDEGRPAKARFLMDAGVLKDEYVLAYVWTPLQVSWTLVGKSLVQRSQVGSYLVVEMEDETLVTYSLAVDIAMPMLGMFKRKAEKIIMDAALKELKKRVESLAAE